MGLPYEQAGFARLLRPSEGWRPVGPLLPPLEDDGLHDAARIDPPGSTAYRQLPASIGAEPGDTLIARERVLRLLDRCGPDHPAVAALRDYMHARYDAEWADGWLGSRDVWSCRVEDPVSMQRFLVRVTRD